MLEAPLLEAWEEMAAGELGDQGEIPTGDSLPGLLLQPTDRQRRCAQQQLTCVAGRGARVGVHSVCKSPVLSDGRKIPYPGIVRQEGFCAMNHIANEKAKLLNRLKRMRGQIEAMERAVDGDNECAAVLQQATACRGALDGFIAEVIEDHIREHMVDPRESRDSPQVAAAEELIEIVHQYLKK
jgi:FrmR/RcnR family transcriptional regulator, repressor of frmRAB operon